MCAQQRRCCRCKSLAGARAYFNISCRRRRRATQPRRFVIIKYNNKSYTQTRCFMRYLCWRGQCISTRIIYIYIIFLYIIHSRIGTHFFIIIIVILFFFVIHSRNIISNRRSAFAKRCCGLTAVLIYSATAGSFCLGVRECNVRAAATSFTSFFY